MAQLTAWDWIVLVVGILSVAAGVRRGAIRTLLGLAAWIAGLLAAVPMVAWIQQALVAARAEFAMLGDLFGRLSAVASVPTWVWYVVAFLFLFITVRVVASLVLKGAIYAGLGGFDRLLGGVVGVARAALIIMIAALIAQRLGFDKEGAWQQARSRALLEWLVVAAESWLPAQANVLRAPPLRLPGV